MDPHFELHHGHEDPVTGSPGGLNIHDPVLDSTPRLRSLKKQLIPAIVVFALALGVGPLALGGGFLLMELRGGKLGVGLMILGGLVLLAGVGYFAYVTIALNVYAKEAKRVEARRQVQAAAASSPEAAKALEAMLEHLSK